MNAGAVTLDEKGVSFVSTRAGPAQIGSKKHYRFMVPPEHRVPPEVPEPRIGVRLTTGDDLVGVVTFSYYREHADRLAEADERFVAFLNAMAGLITLAVERALDECIQREAKRLQTTMNTVAEHLIAASQPGASWQAVMDDIRTGFQVERCAGPSATCTTFVQIAQTSANITGLSDLNVTGQATYTYRVRAFNNNGPSAYSNTAQVTTPNSPPSTQVVPSGVQRIGAAPGALSWTGAGVGVAVVDTGLDFAHADLALQPEVPGVNSYNAVSPGTACQDIHGHGTHVAGSVLGNGQNSGSTPSTHTYPTSSYVGIAPEASLVFHRDHCASAARRVYCECTFKSARRRLPSESTWSRTRTGRSPARCEPRPSMCCRAGTPHRVATPSCICPRETCR